MFILKYLLLFPLLCFAQQKYPPELIAHKNNAFSFSLASKLPQEGNCVFSPFSLYAALSMTLDGAKGKTAAEIAHVLGVKNGTAFSTLFPLIHEKNLHLANALWVAEDAFILSSFLHRIENVHQGHIQRLSFENAHEALDTINTWTSTQTEGRISRLLHPEDIDPSTRLVLTNALYFTGEFASPFSSKSTKTAPFYPSQEAEMMEQTGFFLYGENSEMQWLSLPFKESQKALVIFLATEKDQLPSLTASSFTTLMSQMEQKKVRLKLPKFCLRAPMNLNSVLASLGMKTPFSKDADFSAMDGMHDLFLNKVIHETFFSVDEQGVTAAASSAASIHMKSSKETEPSISFVADHPFFFFVVDMPTKTLLFSGILRQPCSSCP